MNEQLKAFINGVGAICEMWMITYNGFIKQGLAHNDAMMHTQGLMKVLIGVIGGETS